MNADLRALAASNDARRREIYGEIEAVMDGRAASPDLMGLLRSIHGIIRRAPMDRLAECPADFERDGRDLLALLPRIESAIAALGDADELIVRLQHYVDHLGDMQDGFAGGDPQAVRDALGELLRQRALASPTEAMVDAAIANWFRDTAHWDAGEWAEQRPAFRAVLTAALAARDGGAA